MDRRVSVQLTVGELTALRHAVRELREITSTSAVYTYEGARRLNVYLAAAGAMETIERNAVSVAPEVKVMPFDVAFLGALAVLTIVGLAMDQSGTVKPEGKGKGKERVAVKGNRAGRGKGKGR